MLRFFMVSFSCFLIVCSVGRTSTSPLFDVKLQRPYHSQRSLAKIFHQLRVSPMTYDLRLKGYVIRYELNLGVLVRFTLSSTRKVWDLFQCSLTYNYKRKSFILLTDGIRI